MEADPNIMPKFELISLPRVCRVAHFIFDHITSPGLSDHANRGGAPMLDRELYDQQELDYGTQT